MSLRQEVVISFFITCIKSVCDYALPVFHSSLPEYLVRLRAGAKESLIAITCPNQTYSDAFFIHKFRLIRAASPSSKPDSLFNSTEVDISHRLHRLLPPLHTCKYYLRHLHTYDVSFKTNRAKSSFFLFLYNLFLCNCLLVFTLVFNE